jgi:NADPH-dependent 2,4-dienoyl-CoA reductase/sulfur reductase-like enzyme
MSTSTRSQRKAISFQWNGQTLTGMEGDTIAVALHRIGILTLARTRKHHRPIGYSGSYLSGVLARVNGIPNVRLDLERLTPGMEVHMQNVWPSARYDLLAAAQLLPAKMLYGGFEHSHWTPQGQRSFGVWERLMAFLAGMGEAPDPSTVVGPPQAERHRCDVLVIGGGAEGRKAANRAAASGRRVAIASRGDTLGRFSAVLGAPLENLHPAVQVFPGIEIFGAYRDGTLLVGAPHQHDRGAIAFDTNEVVLAIGRRSIPPLVPGNHIPGVMDAHSALRMAYEFQHAPGKAVAVLGTGAEGAIADKLQAQNVNVVHVGPIGALTAIRGRRRVNSINVGRVVPCDAVVHAGPWRADPNLLFQLQSEGQLQLELQPGQGRVTVARSANNGDEVVPVSAALPRSTLICPCMDVTAGEILSHIEAGETDPEVLKRLTSCGMGPCQGFPCWDAMIALLASKTNRAPSEYRLPSHRSPRRAITVAQAAGLTDVVEPLA